MSPSIRTVSYTRTIRRNSKESIEWKL